MAQETSFDVFWALFSFSLPPCIPSSCSIFVPSLGLVIPVIHSCHPIPTHASKLLAAVVLGAGGCVSWHCGIEAAVLLEHT